VSVLGNIDKLAAHLRRAHLALNLAVGRTEGEVDGWGCDHPEPAAGSTHHKIEPSIRK
jgi:hypothetical protein